MLPPANIGTLARNRSAMNPFPCVSGQAAMLRLGGSLVQNVLALSSDSGWSRPASASPCEVEVPLRRDDDPVDPMLRPPLWNRATIHMET